MSSQERISSIYDKEMGTYMTEKKNKGIKIYEEDRFKDEFEFIKNVLGGKNEKK